jgi:hypothetical protein
MANRGLGFSVEDHIRQVYADRIGMDIDPRQNYPDRVVGTMRQKPGDAGVPDRVSILIRPVGADNAGRYRRWITYRAADFDSMITRPTGWRYYALMVGLLPDGKPWWSALYDEAILRQPDVYEHAEQMGSTGRFYRFDPGLSSRALIDEYDFTKPEEHSTPKIVPTQVYRCSGCALLTDQDPGDETFRPCPVCGDDSPLFVYERIYPSPQMVLFERPRA